MGSAEIGCHGGLGEGRAGWVIRVGSVLVPILPAALRTGLLYCISGFRSSFFPRWADATAKIATLCDRPCGAAVACICGYLNLWEMGITGDKRGTDEKRDSEVCNSILCILANEIYKSPDFVLAI